MAFGTNILVNGNFTGGTSAETFGSVTDLVPNGWYDAPPDPNSLSNLNVVSPSAFPSVANTIGATYYVAFQSTAQNNTQDCLLQVLNTTPGMTYTISFYAAVTAASSYLQLSPDFDAYTSNDLYALIPGLNNGANPTTASGPSPFTFYSFNATASTSQTYFYFHGVDSNGAILLADVSVNSQSSTPEPQTLWLIFSGLVGLVFWRWTKKARAN